jgi:C-terminal processing protease CtpA/Prc
MKKLTAILILLTFSNAFGQTKYQKDYSEFWKNVQENYAYTKEQNLDFNKLQRFYQPKADSIKNNTEFIGFLEILINEFYNGHISLNTNLSNSNRIIPSGSDIYVEKIETNFSGYKIKDVRKDSRAEKCGLTPDFIISKFNDKPVEEQLKKFLPGSKNNYSKEMYQYAVNMLFAGTRNTKRKITVIQEGIEKNYFPDDIELKDEQSKKVEFKIIQNNKGYIKFNNSLGDDEVMKEFDIALDSLFNTSGLIVDLSETPGGGNSTIARFIMSRFIKKDLPYQKHILAYDEINYGVKRSWVEYVSPRNSIYTNPLVIIVGYWTGSMGEGMAIGFDSMKRAKIIGTKMAGLIGAVEEFTLSETKIGYQIPTERLYHINGTPREKFIPKYLTNTYEESYKLAIKLLNEK